MVAAIIHIVSMVIAETGLFLQLRGRDLLPFGRPQQARQLLSILAKLHPTLAGGHTCCLAVHLQTC